MTVLLVALGAAVGAPLRFLTDRALAGRSGVLPAGTLVVNVLGSGLLGLLGGLLLTGAVGPRWMVLAGTGFCGALTTFSTFGYETVRLVEQRSGVAAAGNVAAHLTGGLVAVTLGWMLGAWLG